MPLRLDEQEEVRRIVREEIALAAKPVPKTKAPEPAVEEKPEKVAEKHGFKK